ncbi:hypothetical protein B0H11DRAFT_2227341 [Mycena galericulata]|nr:hypothetical protein B0H11DRAFT_2227341 [Mycena galericulata]
MQPDPKPPTPRRRESVSGVACAAATRTDLSRHRHVPLALRHGSGCSDAVLDVTMATLSDNFAEMGPGPTGCNQDALVPSVKRPGTSEAARIVGVANISCHSIKMGPWPQSTNPSRRASCVSRPPTPHAWPAGEDRWRFRPNGVQREMNGSMSVGVMRLGVSEAHAHRTLSGGQASRRAPAPSESDPARHAGVQTPFAPILDRRGGHVHSRRLQRRDGWVRRETGTHTTGNAEQAARVPPARIRAWTLGVRLGAQTNCTMRELWGDGGLTRKEGTYSIGICIHGTTYSRSTRIQLTVLLWLEVITTSPTHFDLKSCGASTVADRSAIDVPPSFSQPLANRSNMWWTLLPTQVFGVKKALQGSQSQLLQITYEMLSDERLTNIVGFVAGSLNDEGAPAKGGIAAVNDIDSLADSVPPRLAIESDKEEDDYNPLCPNASQPTTKPVVIQLVGDAISSATLSPLQHLAFSPRRVAAVMVNDFQVGMLFRPLCSYLRRESASRWPRYTRTPPPCLTRYQAANVGLLETYPVPTYISEMRIPFADEGRDASPDPRVQSCPRVLWERAKLLQPQRLALRQIRKLQFSDCGRLQPPLPPPPRAQLATASSTNINKHGPRKRKPTTHFDPNAAPAAKRPRTVPAALSASTSTSISAHAHTHAHTPAPSHPQFQKVTLKLSPRPPPPSATAPPAAEETYPYCLCVSPSFVGLVRVHDLPVAQGRTRRPGPLPQGGAGPFPSAHLGGQGQRQSAWMAYEACARVLPETWVDEVDVQNGRRGSDGLLY